MTRIGGAGPDAAGTQFRWSGGARGEMRDCSGRLPEETSYSTKRDLSGEAATDGFEPDHALTQDRQAAFTDKLRREVDGNGADAEDLLVIAVAGEVSSVRKPSGAGVAPIASGIVASIEHIGRLVDRVERSIDAEMRISGRREFSLRIDLRDMKTGLGGLTISMTSSSLDVVLIGADPATAGFRQAVQSLADQLRARFPQRVVRIHRPNEAAEKGSTGTLDEISRLLTHRAGRS